MIKEEVAGVVFISSRYFKDKVMYVTFFMGQFFVSFPEFELQFFN